MPLPAPAQAVPGHPQPPADSGPTEGASIRLVHPWVLRCAEATASVPPGGFLPPQLAGAEEMGGAPADAPVGIIMFPSGGAAAAEEATLDVYAFQPLEPGTNELIISFNGRVLLRRECDGDEAAQGHARVSLPAPEVEGVLRVRSNPVCMQTSERGGTAVTEVCIGASTAALQISLDRFFLLHGLLLSRLSHLVLFRLLLTSNR